MASQNRRSSRRHEGYTWQTHRPLNCLVFILPMLLFFQIGTAYYGTTLLAPRHLGKILKYFGATAAYLPALLIVAVLLIQHVLSREKWTAEPKALAGMFGESVLWTTPLIAMSYLCGSPMAGVAILLIFVDIFSIKKGPVLLAAVVASGCLFSLYHFPFGTDGAGGFHWAEFIFRAAAGIYLGLIFIARGFAVAVGTHTFFNLFVVIWGL